MRAKQTTDATSAPHIRLATALDVPVVAQIVNHAYRRYIPRIGRPPAPMLDDHAARVADSVVWVVEDGNTIAGLVVLLPEPDHLLLDNIAVVPARQGTGLGRQLLIFAEAEAIRRGYSEIRLYTNVLMTENRRLYAAIGYEETGRGTGAGFERVFMRKLLSGPPIDVTIPVQKQLEAYNARDIDAFMQWWADDCQYYEFPSRLLAIGAAEIRERHTIRFKEPDLDGRLIHRAVVGNKVIDQEIVTRNFQEGARQIDVVAIYEIEHDKIAKAWFILGNPSFADPA